jgi:hypothetical protein
MARVQYGTIVTEIKGKNQGHVFQGGNVGFVLRSKGYTKGISSQQRSTANSIISLNASLWRKLSDAQRTLWNNLAPNWLFVNKFGQTYQGNGFQIFCAYNGYYNTINQAHVNVPGTPSAPPTLGPSTLTFSLATVLQWSDSNSGDAGDYVSFYASAPVSAGRNTNHARYKLLKNTPSDGSPDYDLTSEYEAMYGTPHIGQRVIIKQISLRTSYPYPYYPTILSCLVTA